MSLASRMFWKPVSLPSSTNTCSDVISTIAMGDNRRERERERETYEVGLGLSPESCERELLDTVRWKVSKSVA